MELLEPKRNVFLMDVWWMMVADLPVKNDIIKIYKKSEIKLNK